MSTTEIDVSRSGNAYYQELDQPDSAKKLHQFRNVELLMKIYESTPELGDFCLDLYNENKKLQHLLKCDTNVDPSEISLSLLMTYERILRREAVPVIELATKHGICATANVIAGLIGSGSVILENNSLIYRESNEPHDRMNYAPREDTRLAWVAERRKLAKIAKVSVLLCAVAFALSCSFGSLSLILVFLGAAITAGIIWLTVENELANSNGEK